MQRFSLSTADIPAKDRFAYWREQVSEGLIGVTGERREDAPGTPFSATIDAHLSRALAHFHHSADPYPVARGPRQIARLGWEDWIWLYQERSPGARFRQNNNNHNAATGDLCLADPTETFTTMALRRYDHDIWMFPRKLLEPHLPSAQFPRNFLLQGSQATIAITRGYLEALSAQLDQLADDETDQFADHACRLLAIACGANGGAHRTAVEAARLVEAKRYVQQNLANPALTPTHVAAALKMSVRQLHLLFEPTGASFARHVLQQRLEECRAALVHPLWRDRAITDIAFAWGFNSLATFYRTFRQAYGMTPSDCRAMADLEK